MKRIISGIIAASLFIALFPVTSLADVTPASLVSDCAYSFTYADIDCNSKNSWLDAQRYYQLGYSNGSGSISVESSGIGSYGNSIKMVTGSSEETQINDIRAEVNSGVIVYSADFLFKDFRSERRIFIYALRNNGSYSWDLGGFKVRTSDSNSSYFVTGGSSSGKYSDMITADNWNNIKLVVDFYNKKIYYFLNDILITSASCSNYSGVYRLSVESMPASGSVMYMDNVKITAYSRTYNTPSIFESDESLKNSLNGYGAVHIRSGCVLKPDGTKILSDNIPVDTDDGDAMVDSSVLNALFGTSSYSGVKTQTQNGVTYYSLKECAAKAGKACVSDNTTANGRFFIIGNSAYSIPSGDSLQKLSDFLFYLRPGKSAVTSLYQNSPLRGSHPRLLASDGDFARLNSMAASSGSDMASLKNAILSSADEYVRNNSIVTHTKNPGDDLRMNYMASEFDLYMYTVAVAWQITKNTDAARANSYVQYAWRQMQSVASFPDWNPMHMLDIGIFASGYAVAYDIMYDAWTDEQRRIIEEGALKNGILQYMQSYAIKYSAMGGAPTVNTNVNAIVNGDAILIALAFMDVYPDECAYLVSNAVRGLESMLYLFAPEGSWNEGVFYLCLCMQYLCPSLAALENVLGSCLRLDTVAGFDGAGDFIEIAQSDVGIYNYADNDIGNYLVDFWYQNHFGRNFTSDFKGVASGKYRSGITEAKAYIAAADMSETATERPLDKFFEQEQLVAMHDSYDEGQTFVGIKAGGASHIWDHKDGGSFVFDSMGVRWAHDLGKDDYNLPDYNDISSGRWKIFRTRAEAHNTIVVDPDMNPDQLYGKSAPVTSFETTASNGVVKINTAPLYEGRLADAERTFLFTDNRKSLVVRDDLTTLSGKTSDIYWLMYTRADAEIDSNNSRVILTDKTDNSKKLIVKFLCSSDFDIIYEDAKPMDGTPVVNGQNSNSGFYRLALKTRASGDVNITVKLTPFQSGGEASESFTDLWKPSQDATLNSYFETVNFDDRSNHNLVVPTNVSTAYDSVIREGNSGYSLKATSTGGADISFRGKRTFNAGPNNADNYMISYDFYLSKIPQEDTLSNTVTYYTEDMTTGSEARCALQVEKETGKIRVDGVASDYTLNAGEWHNFTFVMCKTKGVFQYFYDGNLVATSGLGYAAHIYDISLYFPKEDGLSVYIDNAKIAAVEPKGSKSDFELKWKLSSDAAVQAYFETVDFDDQSNHNLVRTSNVTTAYDSAVKQGNTGYSLKTSAANSGTASLDFRGIGTFTGGPTRADVYMITFDFYLSKLPTAGNVRSSLFFKKKAKNESPGSFGTDQGDYAIGGLQIKNDGTGQLMHNGSDLAGMTIGAGEWHNYTIVMDKKNAAWYEYYDGNQIYYDFFTSQVAGGDYAHIYEVTFDYSPGDSDFYLYVDNAKIAALENASTSEYELTLANASYDSQTGKVNVVITNDGEDNQVVLLIADIRDGELVGIAIENVVFGYGEKITEKNIALSGAQKGDSVRVMLWHDLTSLVPVCSAIGIEVN